MAVSDASVPFMALWCATSIGENIAESNTIVDPPLPAIRIE